MQFQQKKSIYSVTRITGPQHNLLQFKVPISGEMGLEKPPINELKSPSNCEPLLIPKQVRKHIRSGLSRARAELGKLPAINEIRFLVSDTGPESIYDELAYTLACHITREIESSNTSAPPMLRGRW